MSVIKPSNQLQDSLREVPNLFIQILVPKLMNYNGGVTSLKQLERDIKPDSLYHPMVDIITSSTMDIKLYQSIHGSSDAPLK